MNNLPKNISDAVNALDIAYGDLNYAADKSNDSPDEVRKARIHVRIATANLLTSLKE